MLIFSQINCFHFKDNMREFVACSNETNIKCFSILEPQSVVTLHSAHTDNIKKVEYVDDNLVLSGSADRVVKLWDLRMNDVVDRVKVEYGGEDWARIDSRWVVANGNALSIIQMGDDHKLSKI